jgi:hypothetical protein
MSSMDFINAFRAGRQVKQERETEQKQTRFNALAGDLYGTQDRAPVLSQMAQIDPAQTVQFGNYFANQDKQAKELATAESQRAAQLSLNKALLLRAAPKGRKSQLYKQIAADDYMQATQQLGREPTDDEIDMTIDQHLPQLHQAAGVAFKAPEYAEPKRDIRSVDGSLIDVTDPTKPNKIYQGQQQKPSGQFRALTAQEIEAAGLPAGTSAQVDLASGKIDVLSKRDNTGVLSQKDATTAKLKLNTVALARKQLSDIRDAFEGRKDQKTGERSGGIKGTASAGYFGQGYTPSEGGRKFDAAVDQMRSTLTALTRVPGVGAMSDYETKLDQSKFPTRKNYESVTQQQIDALEDQLALIESGYQGLLGGQSQQPSQQAVPTQTATNPQTGEKIGLINGQWVPLNGR